MPTSYSTKVQFLGVACLQKQRFSSVVAFLCFAKIGKEIVWTKFSATVVTMGLQFQHSLSPAFTGELWVCPLILFALRQRSIVTDLI